MKLRNPLILFFDTLQGHSVYHIVCTVLAVAEHPTIAKKQSLILYTTVLLSTAYSRNSNVSIMAFV